MMQEHLEPEENQQGQGALCLQSLIRVLWGAYSTLFIVEILALWH